MDSYTLYRASSVDGIVTITHHPYEELLELIRQLGVLERTFVVLPFNPRRGLHEAAIAIVKASY